VPRAGGLAPRHPADAAQGVVQDAAHCMAGVERGVRVLEHELDPAPLIA